MADIQQIPTIPTERTPPSRLPSLTGLRFFAALLVFLFHAFWQYNLIGGGLGKFLNDAVGRAGFLGVGFFFVLSGFVLTWAARPGDQASSFWRRRLVKIYPNHAVTLVATVILILATGSVVKAGDLLPNIALIQSWFPSLETTNALNGVSWSLAVEAFFYLSFPFLLKGLNRLREGLLWASVAVVAAVILIIPLISTYLIPADPKLPFIANGQFSFPQIWFTYFFPPARLPEFILGMLLARIVLTGRWPRIGLVPATLIAIVGSAVILKVPYLYGVGGVPSLWIAPLIASAASSDVAGSRSVYRAGWLVWLGEISFAFYMVHWLILQYGLYFLKTTAQWPAAKGIAMTLLALAASVLVAWLLHAAVEKPMVRRFSRPRSARIEIVESTPIPENVPVAASVSAAPTPSLLP
jgi:peptidoglycan/LPS O-acetylase OafA/YrhL